MSERFSTEHFVNRSIERLLVETHVGSKAIRGSRYFTGLRILPDGSKEEISLNLAYIGTDGEFVGEFKDCSGGEAYVPGRICSKFLTFKAEYLNKKGKLRQICFYQTEKAGESYRGFQTSSTDEGTIEIILNERN